MTGSPTAVARTRVLFVNSGILGHRAVAELFKNTAARIGDVTALHINLSENLVRAMRALVQSPGLRARMGAAARERMLTIASPETYAAKLDALIKHVQESHVQHT